jgi:hypothetical protein
MDCRDVVWNAGAKGAEISVLGAAFPLLHLIEGHGLRHCCCYGFFEQALVSAGVPNCPRVRAVIVNRVDVSNPITSARNIITPVVPLIPDCAKACGN